MGAADSVLEVDVGLSEEVEELEVVGCSVVEVVVGVSDVEVVVVVGGGGGGASEVVVVGGGGGFSVVDGGGGGSLVVCGFCPPPFPPVPKNQSP